MAVLHIDWPSVSKWAACVVAEMAVQLPTDLLGLFAIGAVLPLVVTLVTKWAAPDWVKNVVNVGLAILAGSVDAAVDSLQAGREFSWAGLVSGVLVAWLASVFAYSKLWKNNPLEVSLARASADVGVSGPLGPTSKPAPAPVMKPNVVAAPTHEFLDGD